MLRSTRRVIVLAILCIALGLSFVTVASAHHDAPGHGGSRPAQAPSGGSGQGSEELEAEEEGQPEASEVRDAESQEEAPSETDQDETGAEAEESGAEAEQDPAEGDEPSDPASDETADEEGDEAAAAEADEDADAAAEGALALTVSGGETLVQLGRTATYGIVVENTGDEPLEDVVVEAVVAPELDVVDAGGADVTGSTLTWTFPVLAPGAQSSLDVGFRLAREGDLLALTEVNAVAADVPEPATESLRTFIGAPRGASVTNPEPRVFEEVTVTRPRQVVVRADEVLGSTILPVTGVPVALLAGLGALLIVVGLLALARASGFVAGTARVMVILLLALTACTADTENGADQAAPDTPAPATSPAETDEEDDEVLGTVVEPGDEDEDEDGAGEGDQVAPSDATDEAAGEVGVALETITIQEQVVRRRLLDPDEIPVRTLGTTQGVNAMSLGWTGSDIDTAASSVVFFPDAIAEVSTGLGAGNGAVDVEVTLRNLLSDERLAVSGRFVHEVSGPGGFNATLQSEPVDVILNPDGTTTYRFTYALPAGDYGLTSRFEANG